MKCENCGANIEGDKCEFCGTSKGKNLREKLLKVQNQMNETLAAFEREYGVNVTLEIIGEDPNASIFLQL
jgi:hypothetical protein